METGSGPEGRTRQTLRSGSRSAHEQLGPAPCHSGTVETRHTGALSHKGFVPEKPVHPSGNKMARRYRSVKNPEKQPGGLHCMSVGERSRTGDNARPGRYACTCGTMENRILQNSDEGRSADRNSLSGLPGKKSRIVGIYKPGRKLRPGFSHNRGILQRRDS